ncbi:hypothetical protein BCR34DRAFT_498471, partial [Clohesyomyces aquaticus]
VLLEFTFKFTKEFFRIKDMYNKFPFPKVIFNKTLIFSLHVFFLRVLFYNSIFAIYNLTSLNKLSKLYITPSCNKL